MNKEEIKEKLLNERVIDSNGCWLWENPSRRGYGQIWINTFENYSVHRLSAHIFLDFDLNSELLVCHKCDIKNCYNPDHLFIGTTQDNVTDKCIKGRHPNSIKTHCPKGHEFTKENTYYQVNMRSCKICRREAGYKYRNSKKLLNA